MNCETFGTCRTCKTGRTCGTCRTGETCRTCETCGTEECEPKLAKAWAGDVGAIVGQVLKVKAKGMQKQRK